jgi:TRAP transporter TAXI family solute receptor
VPVPADVVAKIGEAAYQANTIPANTYNGQTEAVPTVAIQNFLVSHEGVSADAAYKMTKAIFEHLPDLQAAHAAAKSITRENAAKNPPAPLHPGAVKYYKEVGLIK